MLKLLFVWQQSNNKKQILILRFLFIMSQLKCFLKSAPNLMSAEAYYQLGLTFAQVGDISKSQENLKIAIQLFDEMQAPKQIQKVQNTYNWAPKGG